MDNAFGRGLLNGWQLSGISTFASGMPIRLGFSGDAGGAGVVAGLLRHRRRRRLRATAAGNGLAPVYTCDPRLERQRRRREAARHQLHRRSRRSARTATLVPPYNIRTPTRMNHDLTLFKNFAIHGRSEAPVPRRVLQPLQPGVRDDHRHRRRHQPDADTMCNVSGQPRAERRRAGIADNVCDPTQGFHFTQRHDRQLRQDQPQAWPPRHRVRAEVLLLDFSRTAHAAGARPVECPRRRLEGRASALPFLFWDERSRGSRGSRRFKGFGRSNLERAPGLP